MGRCPTDGDRIQRHIARRRIALAALAFAALPYKLGLVVAIVLGLVAGVWASRRREVER